MIRIGVVGDLSLQDPARLEKAMAACAPNCDLICHVGDIHPGYGVVKKYAQQYKLLAVPGNHDTLWDSELGWHRRWQETTPWGINLIGLDNSGDTFVQEDFDKVDLSKPAIIFCHKPLSTIVLSDGSESTHIMGEGLPNTYAEKLKAMVKDHDVLLIHGHYHGWSLMKTSYADCLIEGRGGAAPDIGYSIITITPEGWVIHQVTL